MFLFDDVIMLWIYYVFDWTYITPKKKTVLCVGDWPIVAYRRHNATQSWVNIGYVMALRHQVITWSNADLPGEPFHKKC